MIVSSTDAPFHLRAAAIIYRRGLVLLHRRESDAFWALPGGGVTHDEAAQEAVARELREELGVEARVKNLLLLVENFFTVSGALHHELGLYFRVELDPHALLHVGDFDGCEHSKKLIFRWVALTDLANLDVRPAFLKPYLAISPETFRHVVHRAVE